MSCLFTCCGAASVMIVDVLLLQIVSSVFAAASLT
jgi:hypothetical protein